MQKQSHTYNMMSAISHHMHTFKLGLEYVGTSRQRARNGPALCVANSASRSSSRICSPIGASHGGEMREASSGVAVAAAASPSKAAPWCNSAAAAVTAFWRCGVNLGQNPGYSFCVLYKT